MGAHVGRDGVSYRVWAPDHEKIRVVVGEEGGDTRYVELERDAAGFFSGRDEAGRVGDIYWYQLDGRLTPDPASRFQPVGVEGPSQVVEPGRFAWRAEKWKRPPLRGRVIYELHVGAFTPEGTFRAAIEKLDALVDLGVNTLELMPVADFSGARNWGYDGVMLFAPARCYGSPDDLRALVDAAHAHGLAVMLDVVYNHLGPSGNVLAQYARNYFHPQRHSGWGQALNFDGKNSAPVRQFFLQNACMWLDEYRMDGLRLDAVHAIEDDSPLPIAAEIAAAAHARGAFVVAEDERNDARIVTPRADGGWGVDGLWSDDFHHTMRVALTGERTAHFSCYRGTTGEWADTLREGWLYRGQIFPLWRRPRGNAAAQLPPERFVLCISNHDQVGNRPLGDRLNHVVPPEAYRAVSLLCCLLPYTPLLFMGQEWAASVPFPYFTDLPGELGANIGAHRLREFERSSAHYGEDVFARMPDPQARETFQSAKLNWAERESAAHAGVLALYREALRLRAREPAFQSPERNAWTIEALDDAALALRVRDRAGDWLIVTAIAACDSAKAGEPAIVRPPEGRAWRRVLSSNEARFGGAEDGAATSSAWRSPAPGTWVLRAA
ncbi:MAG TPA: malto-oligosyltrehalose trehalohydrolase [Opitutaceae bacterium]|nr:malto-oligosyltrehalose trehalohydrolase [Opitutaceae bacterium]